MYIVAVTIICLYTQEDNYFYMCSTRPCTLCRPVRVICFFFPAYYAMLQIFSYLPIMLSDFPIMLCGFTYTRWTCANCTTATSIAGEPSRVLETQHLGPLSSKHAFLT